MASLADRIGTSETHKMSDVSVLIEYDYPGTVNGEPVGRVYVTGPHFGSKDIFSHTYLVAEAAVWNPSVAEQEVRRRSWTGARIVPIDKAKDLK